MTSIKVWLSMPWILWVLLIVLLVWALTSGHLEVAVR